MITDCIHKHAPIRKVKLTRPPSPWMKDLNISNLQRTRNEARINHRNHPCNDNLEALKSVRSQLKKSIKMTKGTFLKKLLASKNCAETWKVINKILHPNPATVKLTRTRLTSTSMRPLHGRRGKLPKTSVTGLSRRYLNSNTALIYTRSHMMT